MDGATAELSHNAPGFRDGYGNPTRTTCPAENPYYTYELPDRVPLGPTRILIHRPSVPASSTPTPVFRRTRGPVALAFFLAGSYFSNVIIFVTE